MYNFQQNQHLSVEWHQYNLLLFLKSKKYCIIFIDCKKKKKSYWCFSSPLALYIKNSYSVCFSDVCFWIDFCSGHDVHAWRGHWQCDWRLHSGDPVLSVRAGKRERWCFSDTLLAQNCMIIFDYLLSAGVCDPPLSGAGGCQLQAEIRP